MNNVNQPPEAAYYDMTEEEKEEDRLYCEELVRRMLEAELRPPLWDFFRRRQNSQLRPL